MIVSSAFFFSPSPCPFSGNTGGIFSVDSATGLICIARFLDLNSVGFYTLTVRVTDSGFPPLMATASVRISLILSEYSNPKFSQKEYQAEVNEDMFDRGSFMLKHWQTSKLFCG